MTNVTTSRLRVRQNSSTLAKTTNETLRNGEFFYETDTKEIKVGDGVTPYNALRGLYSEQVAAAQVAAGTYEGRNLAETFATEVASAGSVADFLHARCAAGNFNNIYPMDYWYESTSAATIDGNSVPAKSRKCVIIAIDPYYQSGDDAAMGHHITVMAGLSDYTVMYNSTNNNNGSSINANPWLASKLYAVMNGVNNATTNKIGTVGFNSSAGGYLQLFSSKLRGYMLNQRCFLPERYNASNALTDSTGWSWQNRGLLFAPSEIEINGCLIHANKPSMTQQNPDGFGPYCQFPAFKTVKGRLMFGRAHWWSSSVGGGGSTNACDVTGDGNATCNNASNTGIHAPLCFHIG